MSRSRAPQDLISATHTIAMVSILFAFLYASFVGINQAWKLQTPEVISELWVATGLSFVSFMALFIASLRKKAGAYYYYGLIFTHVIIYLTLITFTIYLQRGMASTAIVLYCIPIIISAISRSTALVFITASACIATYCLSALKYFRDFPSEGYKAELYGQLFFYSFIILLIASLVTTILISKRSPR